MKKNEDKFLCDGEDSDTNLESCLLEESRMEQMECKINYMIFIVLFYPLFLFWAFKISDADVHKIQNINEIRTEACKKQDKIKCELLDELLTKEINSLNFKI